MLAYYFELENGGHTKVPADSQEIAEDVMRMCYPNTTWKLIDIQDKWI